MTNLSVNPVKNQGIPPAIPDELLEDDRKEAEKKAMAARVKAKVAAKTLTDRQYSAYDDAFNDLTQKITNLRILMRLAVGAGRRSLSEADADDLDWMLLKGLEEIDEVTIKVGDAIYLPRESA